MTRRRTMLAGGAGALGLAALGYRAWDRGVFAGASGPAYAPWDQWLGRDDDGERRPLRAAIFAASPHDTQPWLFELSGHALAVYADRRRHLGTFDPFRREMHLGVGCAIENFVRAAGAFGIKADVHPLQGRLDVSPGPQPVLAARIMLGTQPAARDALFEAIPTRCTNRGPYRDEPITSGVLRELTDLVADLAVRVVFLTDAGARRELSAIIVNATERIIADAEMSMDSFRWIRTGRRDVEAHRDGVTIDASGTSPLMTIAGKLLPDLGAKTTDRIWLDATKNVHTVATPVFGMVLVPDRLDMSQAIAAGRAWQRLHLAATIRGLAAQPLNQPVEVVDRDQMLARRDEFGPALGTLASAAGWEPTFVFRIGYALRTAPHSPRRSLSEVVVS